MNDFIPKSFSISKKKDLGKVADSEVTKFAKQTIKENEKAVEDYKSGKKETINFLIGQVMKLSNRRADFNTAKKELETLLK